MSTKHSSTNRALKSVTWGYRNSKMDSKFVVFPIGIFGDLARLGITTRDALVFLTIQEYQNIDENRLPCPSKRTVARKCGLEVASVKRAIKQLKEDGWLIVREGNRTGHMSDTNTYDFRPLLKAIDALDDQEAADTVPSDVESFYKEDRLNDAQEQLRMAVADENEGRVVYWKKQIEQLKAA